MRRPGYPGLIRPISLLLMPWLLASPGHQQPWYWLCEIGLQVLVFHEEGFQLPVRCQCIGINVSICFVLQLCTGIRNITQKVTVVYIQLFKTCFQKKFKIQLVQSNTINSLWPSDAIYGNTETWIVIGSVWINIGSGNGVLPESSKPLPEPILTYYQWDRMVVTRCQFHVLNISIDMIFF